MKRKEIIAIHAKSDEELRTMMRELESEIVKLKKDMIEKKLKNTNLIRGRKDDLARVKTELAHRIKK